MYKTDVIKAPHIGVLALYEIILTNWSTLRIWQMLASLLTSTTFYGNGSLSYTLEDFKYRKLMINSHNLIRIPGKK